MHMYSCIYVPYMNIPREFILREHVLYNLIIHIRCTLGESNTNTRIHQYKRGSGCEVTLCTRTLSTRRVCKLARMRKHPQRWIRLHYVSLTQFSWMRQTATPFDLHSTSVVVGTRSVSLSIPYHHFIVLLRHKIIIPVSFKLINIVDKSITKLPANIKIIIFKVI